MVIRLLDSSSNLCHQRQFISEKLFTDVDIHVIRNADNTRMFIFLKNKRWRYSSMKDYTYRLSFNYRRDVGTTFPLLKRFGYTNDEIATIEFSLPALLPDI